MSLEVLSSKGIREMRAFYERGQFLYDLCRKELERTHAGDYAIINIGSGECHVVANLTAAEQFSRRYYPQLFYFQEIAGQKKE